MINLILPDPPSEILKKMVLASIGGQDYRIIRTRQDLGNLRNKKIIFALELPITGQSNGMNNIFLELFQDPRSLENSEGIVLVHSDFILNTKTSCQTIIYNANLLGCRFMGRPMVEATKDLINVMPLKRSHDQSLESILLDQCRDLGQRFFYIKNTRPKSNPKLLLIHSSNRARSNTYALWEKVAPHLEGIEIEEINLWNKPIKDCIGCAYSICKARGMEEGCIYEDLVTDQVFPSLLRAQALIILAPNYNDMLGSNLISIINRLTALFRKQKFYDKQIFSIIVSGHSGIEALAKQLISSLNINKTFQLPPNFSLYAQASDPGSIHQIDSIDSLAYDFAKHIEKEIKTREF